LPLPGSSSGLGAWPVVLGASAPRLVAGGKRSGVSRWADHRSSKFGACPVVSGAPVFALSPEGAPDLSYCWGICCCANATPELMISAKLAKLKQLFPQGFFLRSRGFQRETPCELVGFLKWCGSGRGNDWTSPRMPWWFGRGNCGRRTPYTEIIESANQALVAERPVVLPHI
jgi:hypothetical protein